MAIASRAVVILGHDQSVSAHVKELVEFMDMPHVITAMPEDWKLRLGESRLEAMFVNPDVTQDVVSSVLQDLSEMDPNVPIVMLGQAE